MKTPKEAVVLVVGAGTMGCSIAQVFAAYGHKTYMADLKQEFVDNALKRIDGAIDGLIKEGFADESYRDAVKANLHPIVNDDIPSIAGEADVVFEVVFEDPEVKKGIYKVLNDNCPKDAIFCSNTSGMDVFSVTDGIIENPERLIITHWFNPPHLMKLIEVVWGPKTSEATSNYVRELLEAVDHKPAVLKEFVPGFIVNRIATVICRELYYMIDQGWISGEDAENAMRYTDGLRYGFEGPLALWDFVGLEIPMTVAKGGVLKSLCNDTDTLPLGEKLLAEGKTGVKAGEGVLKYPSVDEYVAKRSRRILQMAKVMDEWDKEDAE